MLNFDQAQALHDARLAVDENHDDSSCPCCCIDCNFVHRDVFYDPYDPEDVRIYMLKWGKDLELEN